MSSGAHVHPVDPGHDQINPELGAGASSGTEQATSKAAQGNNQNQIHPRMTRSEKQRVQNLVARGPYLPKKRAENLTTTPPTGALPHLPPIMRLPLSKPPSLKEKPPLNEKPSQEMIENADGQPASGKNRWRYLPGLLQPDGRREIREKDCLQILGFAFPPWKKWTILTVIFWIQMSMNYNASVFPNALPLLHEEKHISNQKLRVSQLLFLVCYALGCELWAPWSEELGRWPIMQVSLFFVNVWQILGALAPNFASICVCRALGGLSSAGGSVTLGMCADLFESNRQGYAIAYIVLSSVGGSAIGPIFGGLQQRWLNWHWNFWIQLIFGGVVQIIHFFVVPETRSTAIMDSEAKRRRKSGEDDNIWGPYEIHGRNLNLKEICRIWARPFIMFVTEPIVLCLSLLSGFSDALIFVFSESFSLVYSQWGFGPVRTGLAFVPFLIGYFIAWVFHVGDVWRQLRVMNKFGDDSRHAERRMLLLLFLAPLEAIGLFGFAWTTMGPKHNPWIAPMIFSALIAIANYSIYMSTIDYMVAAYGPYSASAAGGNGFARDMLSGISAIYSVPMYENIGTLHLQWASTILGVVAVMVALPIYVFYFYGPRIRAASRFAQTLATDKHTRHVADEPDDESTVGGSEKSKKVDSDTPSSGPTNSNSEGDDDTFANMDPQDAAAAAAAEAKAEANK